MRKKKNKNIFECLAELEHLQWLGWSKTLAMELTRILSFLSINNSPESRSARKVVSNVLARWKKNWKPYDQLSEDDKDSDREFAQRVLDIVPTKCPVYQCDGWMEAVEIPYPKGKTEDDFPDGMAGDNQLPDLVCSNCGALYRFQRFKKGRG